VNNDCIWCSISCKETRRLYESIQGLIQLASSTMGKDIRTFKDKTGKAFGQETYDDAKEGQISEISYMFPRPGADQTPVPKVSFVTGVADLGCGVGYYK